MRRRIVSLIPSATEIVCALGLESELVGRSHECDWPPAVLRLPVLTAPRFEPRAGSAAIDRAVRSVLAEALSIYRVDAEMLQRLEPDVIVTQSQCEVCAASERDVIAAVAEWRGRAPGIVSLNPRRLADVWDDIVRVAEALEVPDRGRALVGRLGERCAAIAERARAAEGRPRVACVEWLEPLMAAANWTPELVEMAGGANLFGEAGGHSPTLEFEAVVAAEPEVIVVAPCGFDMARTASELHLLADRPGWPRLGCVREGRVYLADGNQYLNRPGPRLVESLEILAEVTHPEAFRFGHEGRGWRRAL